MANPEGGNRPRSIRKRNLNAERVFCHFAHFRHFRVSRHFERLGALGASWRRLGAFWRRRGEVNFGGSGSGLEASGKRLEASGGLPGGFWECQEAYGEKSFFFDIFGKFSFLRFLLTIWKF